ncbi:MAG: RNA polymerase sigma factor [Faecousia sp.]
MEDEKIIDLYWERKDEAIMETQRAYGRQLQTIAERIVQSYEDAEESVNDTYLAVWRTIPPKRPRYFFAYLAKICRNFAFGRLDWRDAAKRRAEVVTLSEEMAMCIPDTKREQAAEGKEIARALNAFLGTLSQENRVLFVRRYWYVDTVAEIAQRFGTSESKVKTRLHRIREKLRAYLAQEGIAV